MPAPAARPQRRSTPPKQAKPVPTRRGATAWRLIGRLALVGAVVCGGILVYLDAYIQREFSGRKWAVPALVYGRALELYAGAKLGPSMVIEELESLGYRQMGSAATPGSYARSGSALIVHTRGFRFWDGVEPARTLNLRFAGNGVADLSDSSGKAVAIVRLEPVHIGGIYPAHHEDRILVRLDEVPPLLNDALMAIEDKDFRTHHGVSPRGILRALLVDIGSGSMEQGGSTLTQQLVKNFFLTQERSLVRKVSELFMAILLELHYSKDEILETYLNEIYLGQDGYRAIHGFGLASQYYFNRPIAELEPDQIALLVALVKGPSWYDPWRHPERARERRNLVLTQLVTDGKINAAAAKRYSARPLTAATQGMASSRFYPAYLDLVRRQLKSDYSDEMLSSEGLRIFTGLDPMLQRAAETAVRDTLATIEKSAVAHGRPQPGLEAAMIVTRVDSGEVLAVVGGRRSRFAGFNRALDAARPIGSLAKPAVYLTALEKGHYTLLSPLDDGPLSYKGSNGKIWNPGNYDHQNHGMVRLHRALANSYNHSTARLGLEIGVGHVINTLHRLGVERNVPELPSVLLGAVPLSPLEVAGMYQTIASGGFNTPLRAIREVLDTSGKPLSRYSVAVEQRIDQGAVHLLEYALKEVVREGTARSAYQRLPRDLTVAGKTGTTDDQRDSWFAGYAGDLLAVVWVGRDDNGKTSLTGATGALPVWSAFMAASSREPLRSTVPDGIAEVWVDELSGGVSGEGCPNARAMPFLSGTEPRFAAACTGLNPAQRTAAKIKNLWDRWFEN